MRFDNSLVLDQDEVVLGEVSRAEEGMWRKLVFELAATEMLPFSLVRLVCREAKVLICLAIFRGALFNVAVDAPLDNANGHLVKTSGTLVS